MLLNGTIEFNTDTNDVLTHFFIPIVIVTGSIKCILKMKKKVLFKNANQEEGWTLSWG